MALQSINVCNTVAFFCHEGRFFKVAIQAFSDDQHHDSAMVACCIQWIAMEYLPNCGVSFDLIHIWTVIYLQLLFNITNFYIERIKALALIAAKIQCLA